MKCHRISRMHDSSRNKETCRLHEKAASSYGVGRVEAPRLSESTANFTLVTVSLVCTSGLLATPKQDQPLTDSSNSGLTGFVRQHGNVSVAGREPFARD